SRHRDASRALRVSQAGLLPELEQDAVRVARMDEGRLAAAADRRFADDPDPFVAESLEQRIDAVDVHRQVVEPFAALGEEAADRRVVARRLDELDLVAREPEAREVEAAVPAAMLRAPKLDREEALEPGERRVDRADRDRQVIDLEADA